jgi:hypothetical protein
MGGLLDERFKSVPEIISQSCTQTSTINADKDVVGSKVEVPIHPVAGLAYRITLAGVNAGGNANSTIDLHLGGTNLITLTTDDVTASDYIAKFVVIFKSAKVQRAMGHIDSNALDCECDYAAGAVDCTQGAILKAVINSGNASDTITVEMVTVERWQLDLVNS